MAMKLIKKEEVTEGGAVFIKEIYRSDKTGRESVVKYPKSSDEAEERTPPLSQLDCIEAATEYLMAMTEGE